MAHDLIIRPEAEAELAEAFNWYEGKVQGLGSEFLNSVEAALLEIRRNPDLHPIIYKNIRRRLIRRFPYAVFYLIKPTHVVVLAVFHARRHSRKWKSRK
jgi:toxin ParE1/3/4